MFGEKLVYVKISYFINSRVIIQFFKLIKKYTIKLKIRMSFLMMKISVYIVIF